MTTAEIRTTLRGCETLPPLEEEPTEVKPETGHKPSGLNRRKTIGRFALLNAFVDCTAGNLTRSEILVWLVLYRDARDGLVNTSQANIALRANVNERTVRRAIKRLEERTLLRVVYRGGLNRGSSKYRVLGTFENEQRAPTSG